MWVRCVRQHSVVLVQQFAQPSLEKSPLGLLLGETEGALVGGSGFRRSPQSSAEISPCRMCEVIVCQIAPREDGIDEGETRRRAVAHRHRRRAVQLDHWRGIGLKQHVVECHDLGPVRDGRVGRLGVHRRNRRLDCVRSDTTRRERPLHE